jgi:hypothetical protein
MQQSFSKQSSPAFLSLTLLSPLILAVSVLLSSVYTFADTSSSYRQVELRHRDAFSMQQTLASFADNDVVIIAEGNSLILKGPVAGLNQLVSIIKKLDKPRQQFQVSIYRGVDPSILNVNDKVQDKRWSTNAGKQNRIDIANIEEGSLLIISDSELISVPVEEYQESGKTSEPVSRYSQQQAHQQESVAFESKYQRAETILVGKGVKLVATLVKDGNGAPRVSLKTTYALPSEETSNDSGNISIFSHRVLNRETTLTTRIELGQWQLLSSHQQQSHRPAINSTMKSRTHVSSTQKKGEFGYKVWVKFGLL